MACSLWDSLQGREAQLQQPIEPALRIPYWAGHLGHRSFPLLICNFLRVSLLTLFCKPCALFFSQRLFLQLFKTIKLQSCLQVVWFQSKPLFLQLFESIRLRSLSQPLPFVVRTTQLRLAENSNPHARLQPSKPVGIASPLWESRSSPRPERLKLISRG